MKGDYSDRQRQRNEARRRANQSEKAFRKRQDKLSINMVRESANISRLTGQIERLAGHDSTSRSKQRTDLYAEWDRRLESVRSRIAAGSGLSQATRDRWLDQLKDLLVFSPDAKPKLDSVKEEVKSFQPGETKKYPLGDVLEMKPPENLNLSGLSPRTARAILKQREIEREVEQEQQKNLALKNADLILIDLDISRLLEMYADYQSL